MQEFLNRHRAAIAVFFALVGPLFLTYVHGRAPRRETVIERAMMQMTGPAQAASSAMLSGVAGLWTGYVALVDLEKKNDELAGQVERLTGEALRLKALTIENQRLRRLLEFKRKRRDLITVAAHVIGQDVSAYARVIRLALDAGTEDGVEEGMPVLTRTGLVGRVGKVAGSYAEVMLTVDARSSVSVRVAGKGITGTVEGVGARDEYLARLLYLERGVRLEVNDTLVTSGHDKVFPPGIEVGYILSTDERQRGLYYELSVVPAVNFSDLEEVLIVTGVVEEDAVSTDDGKGGDG